MRLPAIMEDVFDAWQKAKNRPQFKAEYLVTHAITGSLAEGARVSAARMKLNKDETEALVNQFVGYTRELSGANVKPVPPFLFEISKDSRDHSPEVYEEVIMPGFRAMKMKGGVDPAADGRAASAVRKVVGPDVILLADANQGYTVRPAIEAGRQLEAEGFAWLEEPVAPDDV